MLGTRAVVLAVVLILAGAGTTALLWYGTGGSPAGSPSPAVTSTVHAPRPPARTVTAPPHRTPAPTIPAPPPVVIVPTAVTRVEHPPTTVTRTRTRTHTRPAPPPSTRTVTRPPRPPTSSRPNPIRSVVCGLHLCPSP